MKRGVAGLDGTREWSSDRAMDLVIDPEAAAEIKWRTRIIFRKSDWDQDGEDSQGNGGLQLFLCGLLEL